MASRAIELLAPIVDAQLSNVLRSRILAMDETYIKAGRKQKGKMRQAYFWPLYGGDLNEVVFAYTSSREHACVQAIIGASIRVHCYRMVTPLMSVMRKVEMMLRMLNVGLTRGAILNERSMRNLNPPRKL